MKTKNFLILALCLFILGTFISACGGGGKTTPPSYPFIPVPTPSPTVSPSPEPTPTPTPAKYPLELSQTEFTVNVGATDNIIVTLNGEDITQTATYTVDQEAIVSVEGGLITGLSAGFATVTVNAENAESEKTFTVNVIDPSLPTLEVSPIEINIGIEEEAKVAVTFEGEDVTEKVTYTSDEELIATAEKGVVKAKYIEGTATITVSLEGANSASFAVNVKDDSTPVTLDRNVLNQLYDLEIIAKGYDNREELEEIDIPAIYTYEGTKYKIISIGELGLFKDCISLKKVTLPDSLETITQLVFDSCSSLEEITIRDDVVCIFPSAFFNCPNLTKLTTKSGKEINIPENDDIKTVDNVTFIGVKYEPHNGHPTITDVTIPNGIIEIPNYAFLSCKLKSVTIPSSVKTIGENAFAFCNLKSVTIPDSVITIGGRAFYHCSLLKSVTIGKSVTTIGREAFYNCNNSELSINIPNSVKTIGVLAFANVAEITYDSTEMTATGSPWGAKKVNGQPTGN